MLTRRSFLGGALGLRPRGRERAVRRGLAFIYSTAIIRENFADWGHDYLWCFHSIAETSRDGWLRAEAFRMGRERAREWRRRHPELPAGADAGEVTNFAFGSDAADRLGVRDLAVRETIRSAAARFTARDFLEFDPGAEPPPSDVPKDCDRCGETNSRGATACRRCGDKLRYRSRYDVWYDALITTYTGSRYGVPLGAPYSQVVRWLPAMRPYRGREHDRNPDYYDTIYAITHLIYTQNDYSEYRLDPGDWPMEFSFLRDNLREVLALEDSETVGEFLDTLKSFGMTGRDPEIRQATRYLLSTQNQDGSWGDAADRDVYQRYHPTWTAVDGLRDYRWKGLRRVPGQPSAAPHP